MDEPVRLPHPLVLTALVGDVDGRAVPFGLAQSGDRTAAQAAALGEHRDHADPVGVGQVGDPAVPAARGTRLDQHEPPEQPFGQGPAPVAEPGQLVRVEPVPPGAAHHVGPCRPTGFGDRVGSEPDRLEDAGLGHLSGDVVHLPAQQQPGPLVHPETGRDLSAVAVDDDPQRGASPDRRRPVGAHPEVGLQHREHVLAGPLPGPRADQDVGASGGCVERTDQQAHPRPVQDVQAGRPGAARAVHPGHRTHPLVVEPDAVLRRTAQDLHPVSAASFGGPEAGRVRDRGDGDEAQQQAQHGRRRRRGPPGSGPVTAPAHR